LILFQNSSSVNVADLQWSIKNGDLDEVQKIVEAESIDVNAELSGGRCPLHYAADMGQTEVIQYLVSKGADVNKEDKHGITPLLAAVWEGHASSVKALLEAGARKDGKTPDGQSYLSAAESTAVKALLQ